LICEQRQQLWPAAIDAGVHLFHDLGHLIARAAQ
jgi:hypothetical protein